MTVNFVGGGFHCVFLKTKGKALSQAGHVVQYGCEYDEDTTGGTQTVFIGPSQIVKVIVERFVDPE